MEIVEDKLFQNRTYEYILPGMKAYQDNFNLYMDNLNVLAVGIDDKSYNIEGNCLYILIDSKAKKENTLEKVNYNTKFTNFMNVLRRKPYYRTDYVFSDIDKIYSKHMLVVDLSMNFEEKLRLFRAGKYSEMYSPIEISLYFKRHSKAYNVMYKTATQKQEFISQVHRDYDVKLTIEDLKDSELEYPPFIWDEVFNY